jgi:hypothetical protein
LAKSIYSQLQELTDHYFNSHIFVDDLIDRQLGIKPEDLTKVELKKIIDWLEMAAYLLSDNQKTAKNYLAGVNKLAGANG